MKFIGIFLVFSWMFFFFCLLPFKVLIAKLWVNEQKKKKVSKIKNDFVLDPAKPHAGPDATIMFSKNPLPNKSWKYATARIDK